MSFHYQYYLNPNVLVYDRQLTAASDGDKCVEILAVLGAAGRLT